MTEEKTMKGESCLLVLYTETNIHTGTGQSTGAIDNPIDRERHTDYPVFQGSGLKGALRSLAREKADDEKSGIIKEDINKLFGYLDKDDKRTDEEKKKDNDNDKYAGAITPSQANILAFPVRSLNDVFVWVTCPLVLDRLARVLERAKLDNNGFKLSDELKTKIANGNQFSVNNNLTGDIILEDLPFQNVEVEDDLIGIINTIAENLIPDKLEGVADRFKKNTLLVSDEDFTYFVKNTTEVRARNKLTEQKTTGEGGNLWYEESLPRDCLFYSVVLCEKTKDKDKSYKVEDVSGKLKEIIDNGYIQIGGNETLGMGWCATKLYPNKDGSE